MDLRRLLWMYNINKSLTEKFQLLKLKWCNPCERWQITLLNSLEPQRPVCAVEQSILETRLVRESKMHNWSLVKGSSDRCVIIAGSKSAEWHRLLPLLPQRCAMVWAQLRQLCVYILQDNLCGCDCDTPPTHTPAVWEVMVFTSLTERQMSWAALFSETLTLTCFVPLAVFVLIWDGTAAQLAAH